MFAWLKGDTDDSNNKWKELFKHDAFAIRDHVINIGSSIFYSTNYNKGQKGIVEYDTQTNKIINVYKYNNNNCVSSLEWHSICKYKNDFYIVDGINGAIIQFECLNKTFNKIKTFKPIGRGSSCIAFNEEIHIIGGSTNNGEHLIYSPKDNNITIIKNNKSTNIGNQSIIIHNNKLIAFGGLDYNNKNMDVFSICDISKANNKYNCNWRIQKELKLPKPMWRYGYICYKSHIIIFGGTEYRNGSYNYFDSIYICDLNNCENGWKEIKNIKCPLKSGYRAILMPYNNIYLFSTGNKEGIYKCFSISLNDILCELNLKENEFENNNNLHSNENDTKCSECDKLRGALMKIEYEKTNLEKLLNELLNKQTQNEQKQNDVIQQLINENEQLKQKTEENTEYETENTLSRQTIEILRNDNINVNQQREINVLKERNNNLMEEQKETNVQLLKMEKELLKMKRMKSINDKDFIEWTSDELVDYIITINNNLYKKYENILRINFKKEGVNGSAIQYINQSELRNWGIQSFMDRVNICKHLTQLIDKNKNKQENIININENEGNNYNKTEYIM